MKAIVAIVLVGSAMSLPPSIAAAAQTCTEAYGVCSRPCNANARQRLSLERCAAWCNSQRDRCMRTGQFTHIGNKFVGLQRR
jgi:hypothetical protein